MSETETRDAAVEPTPEQWVDDFLDQPRFVQVALAERIIAESRAVTDLAAARAEVAALRSAVEALADEWHAAGAALAPDDDWGESVQATLRGDFLQEKAAALRSLLASVGSSGEAESGEGDPVAQRLLRDIFGKHEDDAPASVPSGGQADGEGEVEGDVETVLRVAAEYVTDAERGQADREAVATIREFIVGAVGDDMGPLMTKQAQDLAAALDAKGLLAARPVLSREALTATFGDCEAAVAQAVEGMAASLPESGPPVLVQRCYATGIARAALAALADVLTAGGEQ